ncbi:hypothetical protein PO883_30345 [Massilia sp. DJPM01]|uniref:hypothetical protein n=1 Tax=Massilia sp. DJPM01 TaxID=3024404 RepID=UPI00259E714B|nr:hypothetical protein [Massilia sp. DJPM01]MDM5181485.1 hypothetical protein [Massilia sp. DJPM01]
MPKVNIRMGDIQWPATCCRCGSEEFSYRTRTEKVVMRSVVAATEARAVTLVNVPVCDRCDNARRYWFAGASAAAAIGVLFLAFAANHDTYLTPDLGIFVLAVFLALIGTTKSPIRIIQFDEKINSLKIQIYNHSVAAEMLRREAGRTDLAGHAEYLDIQQDKQRKQDREVRLTVRTLCLLFFISGLYLVFTLGETTGYAVMILSAAFCLPLEITHRAKK